MAIKAKVETLSGETRECYIRLNHVDHVVNHDELPAHALFRGFVSQEAFDNRKAFVWERSVEFVPDHERPLWVQAYEALKQQLQDPADPLQAGLGSKAKIADLH